MADPYADLEQLDSEKSDPYKDLTELDAAPTATAALPAAPAMTQGDLPWYQRAVKGLTDSAVGAGQLVQHLTPDTLANFERKHPIGPMALPGTLLNAASGFRDDVTTKEVDQQIADDERDYESRRKASGQTGIDWFRIGGNVANPINWIAPEVGAETAAGRIGQAAFQGAWSALTQPATRPGSFVQDKATQGTVGAVVGGALGGALEIVSKPISKLIGAIRNQFGSATTEAQAAAKDAIDGMMSANGVDPQKVDPKVMTSIQQEVKDALDTGASPSPKVIANRADAASLPVPIELTRGQASRDPMQFAWEMNKRGRIGTGEPLTNLMNRQNAALIENMNQLGAKEALEPHQAAKALSDAFTKMDDGLRDQINQAYSAVRNSAGQSAKMNHLTFVKTANDAIDADQLGPYLPATIRQQLNDISEGKLPLTVNIAQQLDKVWNAAARQADDPTKMAIGTLRKSLNETPIADSLGEGSMQAYKAARQMAAQRFNLIDNVPAYKAAIEGVEPDSRFFNKYLMGTAASKVAPTLELAERASPGITNQVQSTAIGLLKKKALNGATDENGLFSQAAYNKALNDPFSRPIYEQIFSGAPEVLGHLDRIGRVSSNIQAFPKGAAVNTSNTAGEMANIAEEPGMGRRLMDMVMPARAKVLRDYADKAAEAKAVNSAVTPGVTHAPLPRISPSTANANKTLSKLLTIPTAIGATQQAQ